MDKTWTDADAKLLRDLRMATGVDRATFARRCTISTGQLTELEEGGSGRFYSESIKNHTGRTLLAKLGHVRRVIEADRMDAPSVAAAAAATAAASASQASASQASAPAPATASRAQATGPSAAAPAAAPSTTPAASAGSQGSSAAVNAEPESAAPVMRTPGAREPVTDVSARPVSGEAPAERSKAWVGIVAAGVVVIGALAWFNRPQTTSPAAVPAAAPEPMAEAAAVPASAVASGAATPEPAPAAVAAPASAPAPAASATQAKAADAACPPANGTPASFTPDRALRPSSYVYFEAQQATLVCVTDATQKKSEVRLKAGERINVSGTPPFTVQAARWGDVRMFFQGVRVPLEDPGMSAGAVQLLAR